jgi:hypothetical protein
LTDEEREELAALIAEEESLLAEIEMAETERLEMKDHASVENHLEVEVEVAVERGVEVEHESTVKVEVQPVPIEIHVQESEIQSLEIDNEGVVVVKDMVTKNTGADKETEGKLEKEGQGMEVQIEVREVEKTIEKEETVTQNNANSVPNQNSKPCSAYENSNESVKSLTPVFARLSSPELKTETVTNKVETKTEPIPLFAVVAKGFQMEKTENDDEWNMNLLASSPLPTVRYIYLRCLDICSSFCRLFIDLFVIYLLFIRPYIFILIFDFDNFFFPTYP